MAEHLAKPAPATASSTLEPGAPDVAARLAQARARSDERLAAGLAMIAGFVDAYGIITFGVYVSFMSGNTTQAGYETAQGALRAAALSAVAILFFVLGSFAATLLAEFGGRHARRLAHGVVAAALAAIAGLTGLGLLAGAAAIAATSFAMGIMNNALSRVGAQSVSVGFVTGALSRLGSHLAEALRRAPLSDALGPWDTHSRRALTLARVWAAFLAGALLSGAATPRFGAWVLAAPALALAAVSAFHRPEPALR